MPDVEGGVAIPADISSDPEVEVACYQCGRFYEMPLQCTQILDVLCSDCVVPTVHADPDQPADEWPCFPTAEDCTDDPDLRVCVLGRTFACEGGRPRVISVCEVGDYCCQGPCDAAVPDDEDTP